MNNLMSNLMKYWQVKLCLLLMLCFLALPQSVVAQPNAFAPGQNYQVIKTLGLVDYVEVNRPAPDGKPKQLVIFVHGTPGSFATFSRYLDDPVMQERFHMISVTRPGWRNNEDAIIPSLQEQAAALAPLLAMDASAKGALLMGHSYGGPVVARTAMEFADQVAGLIFVAASGDPKLSGPRWYNRFAVVLPRFLLGESLKGANAEIMPLRPQLEEMVPRWEGLTMPVLIVQGDRDRLVNPGNALFMQEMLVNSDVRYLHREGKGHFVLWEEAELIRENLIDKFYGKGTSGTVLN